MDDVDQDLEDEEEEEDDDDDLIDSAIFSGEYGELKRSASMRRSTQRKKLLEKKKDKDEPDPSLGTGASMMESIKEVMLWKIIFNKSVTEKSCNTNV